MPKLGRSVAIEAPAERVFAYVDNIRNLARHMSKGRSMPMMGSKLKLEIMTARTNGCRSRLPLLRPDDGVDNRLFRNVTRYIAGCEKICRTTGEPQLLIIAGYEMRVLVEPVSPTSSRLTIGIDYELPRASIWRLLGWSLAGSYSRWCLTSMVEGTKLDLERRLDRDSGHL